ncbi:hypothetical protein MMC24_003299 [Lignoscripta atroalba]|nr:hypothetical protein [Lignoscripta atroalba]
MAPQKIRGAPEDSRFETSSTKEKQQLAVSLLSTTTKARRTVSAAVAAGSNLKDVTAAAPTASEGLNGQQGSPELIGGEIQINWSSLDPSVLHAYRHAYRLNVPSAFTSPYNQMTLTGPGLGRYSPTMARHKDRRRISKDHLALAVRKDFNAGMVQEQEVVTSFLYSIHNQNKNFRMRFAPSRSK